MKVDGNLKVAGSLSAGGSLSARELYVGGELSAKSNLNVDGSLSFTTGGYITFGDIRQKTLYNKFIIYQWRFY